MSVPVASASHTVTAANGHFVYASLGLSVVSGSGFPPPILEGSLCIELAELGFFMITYPFSCHSAVSVKALIMISQSPSHNQLPHLVLPSSTAGSLIAAFTLKF